MSGGLQLLQHMNTCTRKYEHLSARTKKCISQDQEIYQPGPRVRKSAQSSFSSPFSSVLITFGRAGLPEDSAFQGKTRTGLMRSNSQPVHKPRLPAGRPEHAGNSTTLKTKCSFPGCLRQELQRWDHREFEMEEDRHRGETTVCE